jgi:hypothetical protein
MTIAAPDIQVLKPIIDSQILNIGQFLPMNLAENIASGFSEESIILQDIVSAATIPFESQYSCSVNSTLYRTPFTEKIYKTLLSLFNDFSTEAEAEIQPISSTASNKHLVAERNISALQNATVNAYTCSANLFTEQMASIYLQRKFLAILTLGRTEDFEDGVETEFSKELSAYIVKYHDLAIETIASVIKTHRINSEILSEAFRWIGNSDDSSSRHSRRELLEFYLLNSRSARERDGALIGLASMDDPDSIPSLKLAIEKEEIKALRLNMEQVLEQLLETNSEISL